MSSSIVRHLSTYFPDYRLIRNNLSQTVSNVPFIKIIPYLSWKKTMEITFQDNFSITDLFLTIRSYSDSLIITPIQMLVEVQDHLEKGRIFFTESISIHKLSDMSLIDFSTWYSLRWEKDVKYLGHESFTHKLILRYTSLKYNEMYPIYPWKDEILKEILSSSNTERDEKIKILLEKIKNLENELSKYK